MNQDDIHRGTHHASKTTKAQRARDAACWLINVCTNISTLDIARILGYNDSRYVLMRIDCHIDRRKRGEDKYAKLFDEFVKCISDDSKKCEAIALHVSPQYTDKVKLDVAKRVTEFVCDTFGVSKDDLFSKSREYYLIPARFALAWILRNVHKYTMKSIGEYMIKDHSTVVNAIQQFNNMIEQNKWGGNRDTKINIIIEYANRIKQQQ